LTAYRKPIDLLDPLPSPTSERATSSDPRVGGSSDSSHATRNGIRRGDLYNVGLWTCVRSVSRQSWKFDEICRSSWQKYSHKIISN